MVTQFKPTLLTQFTRAKQQKPPGRVLMILPVVLAVRGLATAGLDCTAMSKPFRASEPATSTSSVKLDLIVEGMVIVGGVDGQEVGCVVLGRAACIQTIPVAA